MTFKVYLNRGGEAVYCGNITGATRDDAMEEVVELGDLGRPITDDDVMLIRETNMIVASVAPNFR